MSERLLALMDAVEQKQAEYYAVLTVEYPSEAPCKRSYRTVNAACKLYRKAYMDAVKAFQTEFYGA